MDFAHSFPIQDPIKTSKIFTNNGFVLNGIELPQEMVLIILSHIDLANILECSLVCKLWNNIIKSFPLWSTIYQRKYNRKCKQLPWYVYYIFLTTNYFDNLVLDKDKSMFKYERRRGEIAFNSVERFPLNNDILDKIKKLPVISLRTELSRAMCSHYENTFIKEMWLITFPTRKLFRYIIDKYQPIIYVTNCGSISILQGGIFRTEKDTHSASVNTQSGFELVLNRTGRSNDDVEVFIKQYPVGIQGIVIQSLKHGVPISHLANPIISFSFESIKEEVDEIARHESIISCYWRVVAPK